MAVGNRYATVHSRVHKTGAPRGARTVTSSEGRAALLKPPHQSHRASCMKAWRGLSCVGRDRTRRQRGCVRTTSRIEGSTPAEGLARAAKAPVHIGYAGPIRGRRLLVVKEAHSIGQTEGSDAELASSEFKHSMTYLSHRIHPPTDWQEAHCISSWKG